MDLLSRLTRDGVFSAAHAVAAGIDASELRRLVADGQCHRLIRGWYALGPVGEPRMEHSLRVSALTQHLPGVCPSHHSLLTMHGLPLLRADLDVVHLTRLHDRASRHRDGAIIHPHLDGVVTVAQAIVQTGLVNGPSDALVAADAALHRCLVSPRQLAEAVGQLGRHPHITGVRRALAGVDGRSESPGETLLREVLVSAGFAVTPQFVVHDDQVDWRADLVIDGTTVLVEFDGLMKYTGSSDLVAEKLREDRLRDLGYEVVRVTWSDLAHPERILERIRRAIARARRAA